MWRKYNKSGQWLMILAGAQNLQEIENGNKTCLSIYSKKISDKNDPIRGHPKIKSLIFWLFFSPSFFVFWDHSCHNRNFDTLPQTVTWFKDVFLKADD